TTDVPDEPVRLVCLHDVAQDACEHPDDAVTLVVAVTVVVFLEVVEVRVTDGELLAAAHPLPDIALDLRGAGQPGAGMHTHVAGGAVKHHPHAQHLLLHVHRVRQDLVGAGLERRPYTVALGGRNQHHDRHDRAEGVRLEDAAEWDRVHRRVTVHQDADRVGTVDQRDDI